MTTIIINRATAQQALEALKYLRDTAICSADIDSANEVIPNLEAALAQQAEPVDADAAYQRWLADTHVPALRRMDSHGAFAAGWQAALAQQAEPNHDTRAEFERWAASYSTFCLEREDNVALGTTGYKSLGQTMLWHAWQAALAQQAEPVEPVAWKPVEWGRGCQACGIGADGKAYGYVCPRSDCPTKVTCGGVA